MTEITPQQMIEFLSSYKEEYGVIHMATPPDGMFEAIRQFIASSQEVRDAALEDAATHCDNKYRFGGGGRNNHHTAKECAKTIRALKGKP